MSVTDKSPGPVVLLGSDGPATRIIYHALAREFPSVEVILERRLSRITIFLRRLRSLGFITAVGQVPFRALVVPLLAWIGAKRIEEIKHDLALSDASIPRVAARVMSVNSPEAREALRTLRPSVVAVSGTRIIGRETLASVRVPFVNMHGGITPLYRGVHGGYWALADGRPDLVGTTVHRVDEGIDTGPVIAQANFQVTAQDSFATYPYLHTAAGLPIFVDALRLACSGHLDSGHRVRLPSRLRTHPTIWAYVGTLIRCGIK